MHSSSHPPRTFHNRSARYLGVLVVAALVAALGLPSVAQAQTPAAPTVTGSSGADAMAPLLQRGGSRLVPIPDRISGWSNIQSLASHGTMRRRW